MKAVLLFLFFFMLAVAAEKPNIVFVFTDDQASWSVSGNPDAHPNANTPHMDKLIKSGANLINSFTTTPVCSPSRTGLMTSRYGTELSITDWIHPSREPKKGLDPKLLTFPVMLKKAGYYNGIIGKWHLGLTEEFIPAKFGFDYFMGNRRGGFPTSNPTMEIEGKDQKMNGLTADIIGDDAVKFIKKNKDKTFFLAVHHRAPHTRWLPVAPEDAAPYKNIKPEDVKIPNPDYPDLNKKRLLKMTTEYMSSVRSVDRNLGKIMATLDETGLTEKTVLVFSSDHGYSMGHNGIWHKGNGHWVLNKPPKVTNKNIPKGQRPNLYDNSLRVPTFVRWPGVVKAGAVIDKTVSNLDWFPTFCEIAGIDIPKDATIRGKSIVGLLKDPSKEWDNEFYAEYSTKHQSKTHMRGIRTDNWKLILDFRNPERHELYNLKKDPAEAKNLFKQPEMKEIIEKLSAKIKAKMQELKDPVLEDANFDFK